MMPEQASKLPTELFSLEGQIAVVTGGTGVLGGAMAHGLARAGAKVGVLGRRRERAEAAVRAIEKDGAAALALPADVLDRGEVEAAREAVMERWGRLDVLVNAAGGNMPSATLEPEQSFFDLPVEGMSL
jgi:NAD(P)-dependent dehydrogenase (short-subunit alcohol dehydrogenase family)